MRIRLVNKDGVLSSFRDVANSSLNDGVVFTFVFAFPFFNFCKTEMPPFFCGLVYTLVMFFMKAFIFLATAQVESLPFIRPLMVLFFFRWFEPFVFSEVALCMGMFAGTKWRATSTGTNLWGPG